MPTHHCCGRCEVGRPAVSRVEDGRHLAEEVRAENAGGDDRERPGVDVARLNSGNAYVTCTRTTVCPPAGTGPGDLPGGEIRGNF